MKSPLSLRDLEKVVQGLADQGATVRETKAGWFIMMPDGEGRPLHKTISDHRGIKNQEAWVKRHQFIWPLSPEFKALMKSRRTVAG